MSAAFEALQKRRAELVEEARGLVDNPEATDADLDAAEAKHEEIKAVEARIAGLAEIEARFAEAAEVRKADASIVSVKREERTYRPDGEVSFFADAFRAQHGDFSAAERIARHSREEAVERRASDTSNFTGLVVPQYLTALYAPLARAGQPTVNVANKSVPLPKEGMTINVSRITTGSSVAVQATQNSAVSSTDMDDTLLTLPVVTLAGQQDVSRQLLERGTPGMDQLVFADLVAAHAVAKDAQVLFGTGSNGQALGILATTGINAVTYTASSPTVVGMYSKLADAIQQINSNRYLPADTIIMHPRRWAYFLAAVDKNDRPLVVPSAGSQAFNAEGSGDAAKYGQVVGQIQGVNVVTDANIPTTWSGGTTNTSGTEDVIIVARSADLHVFEEGDGMPRELRFEQTTGGSLTVKLVAYSYFAATAGRYPTAFSVVRGTGLVAPTF